jgi:hypothetical protein
LSEKSPVPPALSANNLPGGRTILLNICQINRINGHAAESDENRSPDSISDTENWLNWNADLDNRNDSEDNWEAGNESDMEWNNGSDDSDTPEQPNVSAVPNVPRLIWPILTATKKVQKALIMVNIPETSSNNGSKKM